MENIKNLRAKYGDNEPIFLEEIKLELANYTKARIFQLLSVAIESKEIAKFDGGVYYFPTQSVLGMSKLNPRKVIEKKYIKNKESIYGFYSGLSLLNTFGLTNQIPNVIEIVTNNESTRLREVNIGNQKIILKKSRTQITKNNYYELMILELFNIIDVDKLRKENMKEIVEYMNNKSLSPGDVLRYAKYVPAKAVKNFISSEVPYAFA